MKRALWVVAVVLLSLSACSGDGDGGRKSVSPAGKAKPRVGGNLDARPPAPVAGGECRDIVTASCLSCHGEARICAKLGKKSATRWRRTVKRMVGRGAAIGAEDAQTLVECLTDETDDIRAMCGQW